MTLSEYLEKNGKGTAARLSELIGAAPSTIGRLANGTTPTLATALKIQAATDQNVTVNDWGV